MADWIESYVWPGIIDLSDLMGLRDQMLVSRKSMFAALGVSEEVLDADFQCGEDVQRHKDARPGDARGTGDGVHSNASGTGDR